jgi:chemotaxis protein methyltransferase CheR
VIATEVAATKGWAEPIRIWSAGCSTGQEAYSLAILLAEDARLAGRVIDIVATDVSHAAIGRARAGLYSQIEIQRGLPARQMIRWFTPSATRTIGRRPRAATQGPLPRPEPARSAAAAGRFDLILCRNVLLYFAAGARGRRSRGWPRPARRAAC